ncbi:DUF2786 domain-containing protein [Vallitalea maricola]|uniref:DUF2786 domain-containing protein n=1 Tax=Vallitalea maricola TaxID=3074433 RepID=A0ACB5UN17_9FIRM|nr:DUF2786 domain-containing protein [Vallitalea sp. AN17-2]
MQNELESIIEKVQKLLRLAESQNEFEAQSAVAKARLLMAKHKLSMNDIQEKEDKVVQGETEKMRSPWKRTLAHVIAKHFRCKTYLRHSSNCYRVIFLGLEEDVELTSLIYKQVVNIINISSRRKRLDRKSYAIGFIQGLDKKLQEQSIKMKKENEEEYALVAVMPVPVIKKYNEIEKGFSGNFKGKGIDQEQIDYNSYINGREDGLNYSKDKELDEKAI